MIEGLPCLENATYAQFYAEHLLLNQPCLIKLGESQIWPATREWIDAVGELNWQLLCHRYGDEIVSVVNTDTSEREESSLANAIARMQTENTKLYIKDWHLAAHSADPFYDTPSLFKDDWMNAYYTAATNDDFRFVYAGVQGTFTPPHQDVYKSYSWSYNVVGSKRWHLFPPKVAHCLRRFPTNRTSEIVPSVYNVNTAIFPLFEQAANEMIVVDQQEDEFIFIPSGWFHQVDNLTDCISINHNWCNSTNIFNIYLAMKSHLEDVENSLVDVKELLQKNKVRDWEKEFVKCCQDVLEQDAGWNWMTFWKMILHSVKNEDTSDWQCPDSCRPPSSFTRQEVTKALSDMLTRTDVAHIEGLSSILANVSVKLNAM